MVPRPLVVAALEVVALVACVVVEDYVEGQQVRVDSGHPHHKQFRHCRRPNC